MKFLALAALAGAMTLASFAAAPSSARAQTGLTDFSASQIPTCRYGRVGMRCKPKPKSTKRCIKAPCR